MPQLNFHKNNPVSPPIAILPVLERLKGTYLLWFQYYQTLPKTHRYSLGLRIDKILVEAIEAIATAAFLTKQEKLPYVRRAIQKIDTAKILLMVLWETKSLEDKNYISISEKLFEVGKMLGGWQGQIVKYLEEAHRKQNSPDKKSGEK